MSPNICHRQGTHKSATMGHKHRNGRNMPKAATHLGISVESREQSHKHSAAN